MRSKRDGMGARGPAPKPTELRVLHGDRKDRINTNEPKPRDNAVTCPDWLSTKAKNVWLRLAPDLIDKGVLTFWDVDQFARYCALTVINREALEDVQENGVKVDGFTPSGHPTKVKNPSLQVARDTATELRALAGKFGLTPSDRASLNVEAPRNGNGGASRLLT